MNKALLIISIFFSLQASTVAFASTNTNLPDDDINTIISKNRDLKNILDEQNSLNAYKQRIIAQLNAIPKVENSAVAVVTAVGDIIVNVDVIRSSLGRREARKWGEFRDALDRVQRALAKGYITVDEAKYRVSTSEVEL